MSFSRLTLLEKKFMHELLCHRRFVTKKELMERLYFNDETGGPDDKIIDQLVYKIRYKLEYSNVRIVSIYGYGYRLFLKTGTEPCQ